VQLAREAADKYALAAVRIVHSLGDVPVGEASVFVQVLYTHTVCV
jgi:molybdopterin synthase catalytic subunit